MKKSLFGPEAPSSRLPRTFRIFALILVILMTLSFMSAAVPHASAEAKAYSAEELAQLEAAATGGDYAAMITLGNLYYKGSYNSGIARDFVKALDWFLKAADSGDSTVLFNIAKIYEKGSAGEMDFEKAYNWYKKAAEAGNAKAAESIKDAKFSGLRWKDESTALQGKLGESETINGRVADPFYLDAPVENCSLISMVFRNVSYTGYPFGRYALYAQGFDGKWTKLDYFQVEKSQAEGDERTYTFMFTEPVSFRALAVCLAEDGMEFRLVHDDAYYVDSACVTEYSAEKPRPTFTPSGKDYPENAAVFYSSAYVNPWPVG
jgi:FOG: TPR repeat, SEL1 subfamily